MAAQEVEVRYVKRFSKKEIKSLWKMYNASFHEVNQNNPCRQSFYKDEFQAAMRNPRVVKLGAFVDGRLVSMAIWSRDLKLFPWISRKYFKKHHPEAYRAGEITYIMALLTSPEDVRKGYGTACAEGTVRDIQAHGGLAIMDMCEDNRWLPEAVRAAFDVYFTTTLQKVGVQEYWELRIAA